MLLAATAEDGTLPLTSFGNEPIWLTVVKALFVFVLLVLMTLFSIVFERKVVGRMQQRPGPNRNGPGGWGQSLADEMDAPIFLPDHAAARAEIGRLGSATTHPAPPTAQPGPVARTSAGEAVLASWHWLLDDGSLQDGEPFLAGTAKKSRLHLSAGTAAELGASQGDLVTVATRRGSLTLPLVIADLPDRVVWLPTRSPDAAVRRDLAAAPGDVVRLTLAAERAVHSPTAPSPTAPSPTASAGSPS